jgi:hypothetical protein
MGFAFTAALLALLLLAGMLVSLLAGRRVGRRRLAREAEGGGQEGGGALDAAVFALFGLLIAFTFSGASSRFDVRRDLIIQEANAIGTAYLRLDLLPPDAQPALRGLFRAYLEARLAAYGSLPDLKAARAHLDRSTALQAEIWSRATEAARAAPSPAVLSLVVPALNEMFDITTTRLAAMRLHPPLVVYVLLYGLGLAASFVAGLSLTGATRFAWTHSAVFALVIAATVYVILDLEFPRLGLVRVDDFDRFLVDVLEGMK